MSESLLKHVSDRSNERTTVSFRNNKPLPQEIVKRYPKDIDLLGGRPNHGFFPITSIHVDVTNVPFSKKNSKSVTINQVDDSTIDIKNSFQYGPLAGLEPIVKFGKDFVNFANKPGYDSWELTFTNGTGDSLHKVFNLLINPGDVVLLENYTYTPVVGNIKSYGGEVVPVETSFKNNGVDVEKLEYLLDNWSESKYKDLKKPKAYYTIPTGQNPTGLSLSKEDRAKVYALAKKHDFIIVEDDPYGYIQLGKYTDGIANPFAEKIDPADYVKTHLPKSYIEFDDEGRVLRLESFSKVFAPGTRLGFIAGHPGFIARIKTHASVSTRSPSGISQAILKSVIDAFGNNPEGWIDWTIQISKEYTDRKNALLKTLYESEAYKKGYFTVPEPDSGMFAVLELNFPESDDYRDDLENFRYKTIEHGVSVVLGKNMAFDVEDSKKAKFLRLTLAPAEDLDELKEAGKRLTDAIDEYFEETK